MHTEHDPHHCSRACKCTLSVPAAVQPAHPAPDHLQRRLPSKQTGRHTQEVGQVQPCSDPTGRAKAIIQVTVWPVGCSSDETPLPPNKPGGACSCVGPTHQQVSSDNVLSTLSQRHMTQGDTTDSVVQQTHTAWRQGTRLTRRRGCPPACVVPNPHTPLT